MMIVHLLKVKWLWNICEQLDPTDSYFIFSTLPTLQNNLYGLDKNQVEKINNVYDKYNWLKRQCN